MALSPVAALSLPLVQSEKWRDSMQQFADNVRGRIHDVLDSEGFQQWARSMDDNMTFMDWTFKYTGIDLSYIWDPELWVKFKEAVWHDEPDVFWHKLAERIEYSEYGLANVSMMVVASCCSSSARSPSKASVYVCMRMCMCQNCLFTVPLSAMWQSSDTCLSIDALFHFGFACQLLGRSVGGSPPVSGLVTNCWSRHAVLLRANTQENVGNGSP
jgi:hypothetical protein